MASVLHSPLPLSHHRTSSSKSASSTVSSFPSTHGIRQLSALRRSSCDLKDDVICRTSIGEVTFIQPPESEPSKEDPIGPLKIKLLVFQRIDIYSQDFDNIVELELGAPWPLPPLEVTATLAYKFEFIGNTGIKILPEKTTVKARGNLSQLPAFDIPQLPEALRNRGGGKFEVTYLDSDTRITRGDRGELRVFVVA